MNKEINNQTIKITNNKGNELTIDFSQETMIASGDLKMDEASKILFESVFRHYKKLEELEQELENCANLLTDAEMKNIKLQEQLNAISKEAQVANFLDDKGHTGACNITVWDKENIFVSTGKVTHPAHMISVPSCKLKFLEPMKGGSGRMDEDRNRKET
jgi:hypothetical protein